jgi:hypothetical protein
MADLGGTSIYRRLCFPVSLCPRCAPLIAVAVDPVASILEPCATLRPQVPRADSELGTPRRLADARSYYIHYDRTPQVL